MSEAPPRGERALIFTVAAIQFISILEFMIVMPLGPDFARDLGIATSDLGKIGGSYTAAAAVAGIVSSTFLERFDRRRALSVAMLGLIIATIGAGLARDMATMMLARTLAGCFGGPAMALALAVVADVIPPERRGKAMAAVMGAFSVASVAGVPLGLKLAEAGSWRNAFFAIAGLGVVVVGVALAKLPPMRRHLEVRPTAAQSSSFASLIKNPLVRWAFLSTTVVMMGGFMLIPNISTYVQFNLGYPRADLDKLYLIGGFATLISMRVIGVLTDRIGAFAVASLGTLLLTIVIYFGFVAPVTWPVALMFAAFMVAASTRNVPYNALTSQVPTLHERARFMALQSSIQHVSGAAGAILASELLTEGKGGALVGIERVAWCAIGICCLLPPMLWVVQRGVNAEKSRSVALASGGH